MQPPASPPPCPCYAPPALWAWTVLLLPGPPPAPLRASALTLLSTKLLTPPHPKCGQLQSHLPCKGHASSMQPFLISHTKIIFQALLVYDVPLMTFHVLPHEAPTLSVHVVVTVMGWYHRVPLQVCGAVGASWTVCRECKERVSLLG